MKGLAGVPNEGPVLLVGYRMLMGLELIPLCNGFLREKNIMVRGLATLYSKTFESSSSEFSLSDWMRRIIIKRQGPFMEEIFRKRGKRERGKRGSRGKRLGMEITLESNLRVNLILVGWDNFNLDWVNFFLAKLFLNGNAMSYPSCH